MTRILASAERLASHALTNEEVADGLRNVGAKVAERGILVVCLNDPRLTEAQLKTAQRLMRELYGVAR